MRTRGFDPSKNAVTLKTPTVTKGPATPVSVTSPTQDVMHLASPPSATKSEHEKMQKEFTQKFAIAFKRKFFRQRGNVTAAHLVSPSVLARYDNDGPNPELIDKLRMKKEHEARIKARFEKERRRMLKKEKLLSSEKVTQGKSTIQNENEDLNLDS